MGLMGYVKLDILYRKYNNMTRLKKILRKMKVKIVLKVEALNIC